MAVVVPVYEEESRIGSVLEPLIDRFPDEEIIVVDDGSSDGTARVVSDFDVVLLQHAINLGKGAALRTGARYARRHGYEHVVFVDGDGQHSLDCIEPALDALNDADLVVGCRSFDDMPFFSWLGNHFFYWFAWLLFGVTVRDTQSGFRALRLSVLDEVMWETNHYAVETEMLVEAARHRVRVSTIDIPTIYHDEQKGTDPLHGIRIVLSMIYWRLTRWS